MTDLPARNSRVLVPILIGALVSVALGVYGANHRGRSIVFGLSGFENLAKAKSVMAVIVLFFALVQLGSALVMYGKIKAITPPPWIGTLHRWSGRLAFFIAVPIGVFCLYGIGFQTFDIRVIAHSLLGCLFFGIFTIKMLVLTKPGLSGWILPVVGGTAFTVLVVIVLTSAYWFFTTQ
jgi:hypothetical protein